MVQGRNPSSIYLSIYRSINLLSYLSFYYNLLIDRGRGRGLQGGARLLRDALPLGRLRPRVRQPGRPCQGEIEELIHIRRIINCLIDIDLKNIHFVLNTFSDMLLWMDRVMNIIKKQCYKKLRFLCLFMIWNKGGAFVENF